MLDEILVGTPVGLDEDRIDMRRRDDASGLPAGLDQAAVAEVATGPEIAVARRTKIIQFPIAPIIRFGQNGSGFSALSSYDFAR